MLSALARFRLTNLGPREDSSQRETSGLRIFAVLFLALAVVMTLVYREEFFGSPYFEEGDDAANALQIHRAKGLRELHGNYSRFGFHHPGPAFFYVYAFGEWLLHDVADIAPAPRNAHVYAGALLQLAFYAAAITLLARHASQPLLALAFALAAGAVHYSYVERVLYSVWPPDVLLMPFLCFVVAAAAVFVGRVSAWPVLILAGSFLVHGHIAQPLFVPPIALVAAFAGWRVCRGDGRAFLRTRAGGAAGMLLAIFLLPIVLDLFAGRASNAYDVLLHLRFQSDASQSLWQSALCYASYFVAVRDQVIFNELTPASYEPFARGAWVLAGWAVLIAFTFFHVFRRRAEDETRSDIRFGRALLWVWLIGSGLTLVWGMKQDGGLTSFNSLFNHSLIHVLVLVAVLVIVRMLPTLPVAVNGSLCVAALIGFVVARPMKPEVETRGQHVARALPDLLRADPRPAAPKLITFPNDDWYEAVTLARALQRQGVAFYVHPNWRVMFGRDRVFENQDQILGRGGPSVWHVVNKNAAPPEARPLNRFCSVVFPTPPAMDAFPIRVGFAVAGTQPPAVLFGIGSGEADWAWTDAKVAAFKLVGPVAQEALELAIDAAGLATAVNPMGQRVRVSVNGELVGNGLFHHDRRQLRWGVSPEIWNRSSAQIITLELPDAIAPATFGDSGDRRLLGLRLYELSIAPPGP